MNANCTSVSTGFCADDVERFLRSIRIESKGKREDLVIDVDTTLAALSR